MVALPSVAVRRVSPLKVWDSPPPCEPELIHVPLTARQPPVMFSPPDQLDVALEVERIEPPVMVSPLDEAKPEAVTPPPKVEVALPWM